jgi:hypothetical protein
VRKFPIGLCVIALCPLTACVDFCGVTQANPNTTYTFSYTHSDGQNYSGEFTTNEYGQGSFTVIDDVDCGKVTIKEKDKDQMLDGPVV